MQVVTNFELYVFRTFKLVIILLKVSHSYPYSLQGLVLYFDSLLICMLYIWINRNGKYHVLELKFGFLVCCNQAKVWISGVLQISKLINIIFNVQYTYRNTSTLIWLYWIVKIFLMFGMFLDNLHFLYTCLIIWSVLSLNVQVKPGYRAKK